MSGGVNHKKKNSEDQTFSLSDFKARNDAVSNFCAAGTRLSAKFMLKRRPARCIVVIGSLHDILDTGAGILAEFGQCNHVDLVSADHRSDPIQFVLIL